MNDELVISKVAPRSADRTLETIHILAKTTDGGVWGQAGLNQKLLAKITAVPNQHLDKVDERIVFGIFENAEFSLENQYSTPFENSNPEGRMPNLMGMIQSGQIVMQAGEFLNVGSPEVENPNEAKTPQAKEGLLDNLVGQLSELQGRSSFTKLNSEQIYTSSNSVRINATLILSAWRNAKVEVENALQALQEWTAPVTLSENGLLVNMAGEKSLKGLFPSVIPVSVNLDYGGKSYLDLVIESLSAPITAPMNANGDRITVKVQISFLSRRAWDRKDVQDLYA